MSGTSQPARLPLERGTPVPLFQSTAFTPLMRQSATDLIEDDDVTPLSPRERARVREGEARDLHKTDQASHHPFTLAVKIRQQFAFKKKFCLALFPLVLLCLSLGCQTTRPLPSVDFQEPGWKVRRGQALWQPNESAPELAGDFLLARHSDGRVMAQFLKIPFPSVTAWREPGRWQIEFQPQNRRYAGRGNPPVRLLFCHVADAAAGLPLPSALAVESSPATPNQLCLRQRDSGEALTITWLP